MGSEVFSEGLRQTSVIGLILFCIALVCGILSLAAYFGEVYVDALLICIPYIPLLIIIYLLRWLGNPHARDFYCTLNVSASDMIKKYILISQIYVWIVFLVGVVPFLIKDAITMTTYVQWVHPDAGIIETILFTLFTRFLDVAGNSMLVTGITLIVCALVYSTVAQFLLTVAGMVLPVSIVKLFSTHLNQLFINTGKSYYFEISMTSNYSETLISFALPVFGVLLIWLGLRAIEKLRIGNAMNLSRYLNSIACAMISFCLILIAAFIILLHLIDSVFVSFHSMAPDPESVISAIQQWGVEVNTLSDKAPWLPAIALCCLSLILLIIFTVRSARRQTKKWIDYTIGFGALVLLCAASFGVFSVYYSNAVKRFAHDEVDYVKIESFYIYEYGSPKYGEYKYVSFTDYIKLDNGLGEEEPGIYYGYHMGEGYRFVKTADGNLHVNSGPGNAAVYFNYDMRSNLFVTEWRNEIKDLLLLAVNRDAVTVETVIGAFAPVPLNENRRYLVIRIYMKDGSSYLRKCFLAESEWKRIDDLQSP